MHTLRSVVDHLSPQLVDIGHLPDDPQTLPVAGFHLPDSPEATSDSSRNVILGVRAMTPKDTLVAMSQVQACGALVVAQSAFDEQVVPAARAAGLALLVLRQDVPWLRLIGALHELFEEDQDGAAVEAMVPALEGDLFEVADWVAGRVNAPVTIEDPQSRVIAFSTHVGKVDMARVESIMHRVVPRQYLDRMHKYGIFRRLAASPDPIFVPGRQPDIQPRVAMAVRAGGEVLGSIWVAADAPASEEHSRVLREAASVVAVQLLRRRQSYGYERRIHTDTVRRLLAGDGSVDPASVGLSWLSDTGRVYLVVATGPAGAAATRRDIEWERHAVADALRTHLLATAPESMTGMLDGSAYSIIALSARRAGAYPALRRTLTDFAAAFTRDGRHHPVHIGIGATVSRPRDLPESRELADLVVQALAERSDDNAVASIDEMGAEALLLQSRSTVRRWPALGGAAVGRIKAFDREHNTFLADTLYAWLCAHGNSDLAAARLHVHPNTVRYRVRQLRELELIDLDDPAERFAAFLHLKA